MQLSIVIPTRNRAEILERLLKNISMQDYPQNLYEVIVIDNGSTDNTRIVCKEIKKKVLSNLRYIFDARPGLHVGRNRGIQESRSEVVAFLDDDVLLFPKWIETVIHGFRDEETMIICGSVIPNNMSALPQYVLEKKRKRGNYNFLLECSCFWENNISENDQRIHIINPNIVFGGNCAYRKQILIECQGFHPDSMPKHLLMYRGDGECYVNRYMVAHKKKCMYYAQASVYHVLNTERLTPDYIHYMNFRNGISNMYVTLREKSYWQAWVNETEHIKNMLKNRKWDEFAVIKGEAYLLLYYSFYRRVRNWVHKENYF